MQPSQNDSFFLDEPIEESSTQDIAPDASQESFFLDEPIETPKQEGSVGFAARTTARSGSRVAETLLGLPGDIREFAGFLGESIGSGLRSLTGLKPKTEEELAANKELLRKFSYLDPLAYLPTSEQLKEISESVTGGYTAPQSRAEEVSDNIVSDFAALAMPVKGKIPFARSIGTSLFANLGSEGVRQLGGGEKGAAATKLGLMTVAGLVGRNTAKKHVDNLYKTADSLIPEGAVVSTKGIEPVRSQLQKELMKGSMTNDKLAATQLLKDLNSKIKNGKIPVDELVQFRRDANNILRTENLTPAAKYNVRKFADIIHKGTADYGAMNPEFAKAYRDANIGFKGLAESNKIANAISRRVNINKLSPQTISLIGHGAIGVAAGSGFGAIPAIGGAATAALGVRTLNRLRNPVLRKHYESLLKAAAKDNAAGIVRSTNLLDKAIKKDVEENPTEDLNSFFMD